MVYKIRVLGVDPGSFSWDFIGYDNSQGIYLDSSIPTKRIQQEPSIFLDIANSKGPFDLITAPSGFGLPLKKVVDMTEEEFFLSILKKKSNKGSIVGLTQVLKELQNQKSNAIMLPSVKHLPTVKKFRKVNKIDLGTADKVCSAVVGIRNQMEDFGIPCQKTGFIMVELGYAFNAVLAVENGQIIDGIGGSNIMGFRAAGALDAELAYLMGKIHKADIYQGGVSSIAGYSDMSAEEILLLSQKDEKTRIAIDAFYDQIKKAVYSITSSFSNPKNIKEILFCGRFSRIEALIEPLIDSIERIAPSKVMRSYAQVSKEAAQGAAFIASGLLDGDFKEIVDNLKIKESSGSILDEIYLPMMDNE
jgi:predicted butyrate kinase (DUF1464 family)